MNEAEERKARRKDAERVLEEAKKKGVYRKRGASGFKGPYERLKNQMRKKEDPNGPGKQPETTLDFVFKQWVPLNNVAACGWTPNVMYLLCILELAFLSLLVGVEYKDCASQFYSNHNGSQDQESSEMMEQGCLGQQDLDLSKLIFSWSLDDNYKVEKELEPLDDLINRNSALYKNAKWKLFKYYYFYILFSDDFRRSFGKLTSERVKKSVLNLLLRLSNGWCPERSVGLPHENSAQSLKQFNVEGLYIISTIDIIKDINYVQVIKVWDVLPFEEIPKLTKRLENIFSAYTEDYISRCTEKLFEGHLAVPRCWEASQEIIRYRHLVNDEGDKEVSLDSGGGSNYVENSKVSESLLLMKFYSFSNEVVCHLLSDNEVELPMQLTDEQMDVLLFRKSSFITGRSGTGKTPILTTKLFQNEKRFCNGSEGSFEGENTQFRDAEIVNDPVHCNPSVLRQLFVTFSPRLCYAVKQHLSDLTSISSNGNSLAEIGLDADNVTSEFSDIPDTFIDIPKNIYPLVITFHKFLMMLDGTLGNSFFERFLEARESSHGNHINSRSVALQTFIRSREVTFDRFCSLYWSHFNLNLTKKLDPSRVFTEIISHIKGSSEGKLSYEGYSLLADSRSSTLSKEKREIVYTLFETYEKMKSENGDFDLGDFVNDIHHRLKTGIYEGDQMDFVYIDEVQDLSMRQISLFKYICHNVEEGFIFAGDTAQTIARGIDFRFQDIRSLFYKEFLSTAISRKQGKGLVSEIKQLKQNFRTHAGVLDLAQSVIDILYCYFVHSIDNLEPEISLISGEAPVLLESCNDENAIVTIFGGRRSGGENVGFGAEQVILVRDDHVKSEVFGYIGRQALVLTISECKGLEFQGYMRKHIWLDEELPQSFPTFNEARHSLLCSELKQLYVAITRTRQRLWICENKEELSKPMFDYWKRRGLVQERKLDDSVAQAMRVASSPQEWRERGKKAMTHVCPASLNRDKLYVSVQVATFPVSSCRPRQLCLNFTNGHLVQWYGGFTLLGKLFYENSFVMARLCFERAGDTMWEKLAKACGLRASADQVRGTHPESYFGYLREAAELFASIEKFESAASSYCDLGEYEKAGKIYMHKCGKFDAAAECFTLAGCYSEAAEAYAKGDQFTSCLSVCKRGKLFDIGMRYIQNWEQRANVKSKELEVKQDFLESCALYYHEHKDSESMMKFVKAFSSMESKRIFLRSLGCLDELLLLEEKSGHFLEAAELARSWGDLLEEANLLEKVGHFKEACLLLLWYVYFNSLWGNGNRGWPPKQFAQKEKLCNKVKLLAKMDSDVMYDFICSELKTPSDQHNSLPELKKDLYVSQKNSSLRGEILLIRKILDKHLHMNCSEYDWEDNLPVDIYKHCEDQMSQNQVTVRTLVFYWNLWKKHIIDIFRSIETPRETRCTYHSTKDADWIRNTDNKGLHKDRKRTTFDGRELVFAIQSYWQSELLSVGIKVLQTLDTLRKSKSNGSVFHQSTSLLHIFEVSKFLLDFYHNLTNPYKKRLQYFLGTSLSYIDIVFPLDWRKSVDENLVSLKETDLSVNLLEEIFLQAVETLIEEIILPQLDGGLKDVLVAPALQRALEDNFRVASGFLSPHSFGCLLDRLLLMQTFTSENSYTTRSFVGSFTHIQSASLLSIGPFFSNLSVLAERIHDILSCSEINNIAYFLPKKFVSGLLRKRINQQLNLDPEVVAEAFLSIDDPLLIVRSRNVSPKINAPCAIFVDLEKSKEEIMSVLFPRKNTHNVHSSSDNVTAGTIPELLSSDTLQHTNIMNRVELQMNWKLLEEISKVINGKKGVALNKLPAATMIKNELDINRGTVLSAFAAQTSWSREDATAIRGANDGLKLLSFMFDTSRPDLKHSTELNGASRIVKGLQSDRPKLDNFLNRSAMSQALKVKQTRDSVVLENQSECDNTQDGNNKKGKGNKGKKSKTSKGKKK
ncbi:UvrD-like helicase, ATP-binding domain, P-loop containing nucleoside triphosphate hydrolase [Tanacetum coccineum]